MSRKLRVLIIVDMQNDFIDGVLGAKEARALVPKIIDKIKSNKYDLIIATRDTHLDNSYLDSLEGKNLPVKHCIFGEDGWQIQKDIDQVLDLGTAANIYRVNKYTFGLLDLPDIIEGAMLVRVGEHDLETIEIVGLYTDTCVISNAMILRSGFRDTPIIVDSSCCMGTTPENHENALKAMKSCQISII